MTAISGLLLLMTFLLVDAKSVSGSAAESFLRRLGKRSVPQEKCSPVSACAMLQINPGTESYWVEEICQCDGGNVCSLEWDDSPMDGKSINNADTQLKVIRYF